METAIATVRATSTLARSVLTAACTPIVACNPLAEVCRVPAERF